MGESQMDINEEIKKLEEWVNYLETRANAHAIDDQNIQQGEDRLADANAVIGQIQDLQDAIADFRTKYEGIVKRKPDDENIDKDKQNLQEEISKFNSNNVKDIDDLLTPAQAPVNQQGNQGGGMFPRSGRRLSKRGQESRRRSSSARKSSSRRGRRSAKKRGTQRKQKRRQRRGSRRAY